MEMTPIAISALAGLLERRTGQQLNANRRWTIETALKPLLRDLGLETLDGLVIRLNGDDRSPLADKIVDAMLNHETFFFRDLAAFDHFATEGLGLIHAARAERRRLRVWSAGCSTGQEAYSLSMAIAQQTRFQGWDLGIFATDVSGEAIARARSGLFTQFEVQRGLPITTLMRQFDPDGEQWRVKANVRAPITFLQHNLLSPPPPGRFDAILCRNVLLYFSLERRKAVLARLREAIAPDGVLMLGAGETVLGLGDCFTADPQVRGVYRPA
ncbi:chemotaxis protein methyltransferase CheR [Sphingomonas vulcanisoli]|uniref:protein-glutamate O-methyltransferase n=1 Tax=Sphingomonas vulcanisoli TaxID=1658060 RepID=A0ABX0TZ24_9SPHN|nr:protein-glutamate O-methyltransferase CheR [Sphingomonas vulcanisoli]NIJ08891.1 chemotaxis protein methyltransferase CheR [Sphingomonas vulcanisoli]